MRFFLQNLIFTYINEKKSFLHGLIKTYTFINFWKSASYTIKWSYTIIWQVRVIRLSNLTFKDLNGVTLCILRSHDRQNLTRFFWFSDLCRLSWSLLRVLSTVQPWCETLVGYHLYLHNQVNSKLYTAIRLCCTKGSI